MRYVCKNPPGGGERNPYQLIDYKSGLFGVVKFGTHVRSICLSIPIADHRDSPSYALFNHE